MSLHAERTHKAFTLIELLVVIAIISILASILFPVFARARENARRASCMSNLKQIGLGVMMYVQDYDETYPPGYTKPGGTNTYLSTMIQPYTKSTQVFYCPSSPTISVTTSILNGQYGLNGLIFPIPSNNPVPLKMAAIQSAASTYMIMDFGSYYASGIKSYSAAGSWEYLPGMGNAGGNCDASTPIPAGVRHDDCMTGRHFGGVNMTFADGHVKWLKSGIVVQEGRKCSSYTACDATKKSAWDPTVDNS